MEDSDIGLIPATGIKSRKTDHLIEGFVMMYNTLKKAGINPIFHQIDNEFFINLIDEFASRQPQDSPCREEDSNIQGPL